MNNNTTNRKRTIRPFTLAALNRVLCTAYWVDTVRLREDGLLNPYHHKGAVYSVRMVNAAFVQLFLPEDFLDEPLSEDEAATFRSVYLSAGAHHSVNHDTAPDSHPDRKQNNGKTVSGNSVYLSSLMNGVRGNSRGWERCRPLLDRISAHGGCVLPSHRPFILELEDKAASFLSRYTRQNDTADMKALILSWKDAAPDSDSLLRQNPSLAAFLDVILHAAGERPALALAGCFLFSMLTGMDPEAASRVSVWTGIFARACVRIDLPSAAEKLEQHDRKLWCRAYDDGLSGRWYEPELFPEISDGTWQDRADRYDPWEETAPLVFFSGKSGSGRKTLLRFLCAECSRRRDGSVNFCLADADMTAAVVTSAADHGGPSGNTPAGVPSVFPEMSNNQGRILSALFSRIIRASESASDYPVVGNTDFIEQALQSYHGIKRLFLFLPDPSAADCREMERLVRLGFRLFCAIPSDSILPRLFFRERADYYVVLPYSERQINVLLQAEDSRPCAASITEPEEQRIRNSFNRRVLTGPLMMHLYLAGKSSSGKILSRKDLLLANLQRIWRSNASTLLRLDATPSCGALQDQDLFLLLSGACAAWCYAHHTTETEYETLLSSLENERRLFPACDHQDAAFETSMEENGTAGSGRKDQHFHALMERNLSACIRILSDAGIVTTFRDHICFTELYWRDFLAGFYSYQKTEHAILTGDSTPDRDFSYDAQGGPDYYAFFTEEQLHYYEERLSADPANRNGRYLYDTLVSDLLFYGNGESIRALADLKTEKEKEARKQRIIALAARHAAEYGVLCYDCAFHLHNQALALLRQAAAVTPERSGVSDRPDSYNNFESGGSVPTVEKDSASDSRANAGKKTADHNSAENNTAAVDRNRAAAEEKIRQAAALYRQVWELLWQYVRHCQEEKKPVSGDVDLMRAALLYTTSCGEPFPVSHRALTGISEDPQLVVEWLREGSERGEENCTLTLAELYEAGRIHDGRLIIPDIPAKDASYDASKEHSTGGDSTFLRKENEDVRTQTDVMYPVRDGRFPQREIPAYRDYARAYRLDQESAQSNGSLRGAGRAALLLLLCPEALGNEPLPVVSAQYLSIGELTTDADRAACVKRYLSRFFHLNTFLQSSDSWKGAYLDILMALGLSSCLQQEFQEAVQYLSIGYRLVQKGHAHWTRCLLRFYAIWKYTLLREHEAKNPPVASQTETAADTLPAQPPLAPEEIREIVAEDNGSALLNRIYSETL